MRVKLVQWNIWCGMNDKLTCQPWAKCATHAAIKIFLSPSPIKFWSQIPGIKNTGLSAQIKTRARTLIVNFIYGAPCLHKMVRKEDRLTLSNHFIKGRYPLGCTLSQIVLKVGINKTSGSKVRKVISRQKILSDGQFDGIVFVIDRFSVILWSGLKAVY